MALCLSVCLSQVKSSVKTAKHRITCSRSTCYGSVSVCLSQVKSSVKTVKLRITQTTLHNCAGLQFSDAKNLKVKFHGGYSHFPMGSPHGGAKYMWGRVNMQLSTNYLLYCQKRQKTNIQGIESIRSIEC